MSIEYPIILKTVSGRKEALIRQLRTDISVLNRQYSILQEGASLQESLCKDLEWLIHHDIADEIKLAFYNPIDPTMVFLEKKYKIGLFNSGVSSTGTETGRPSQNLTQVSMPSPYEFDVFVYFKKSFLSLEPEEQSRRLKKFKFGWFDMANMDPSMDMDFEASDLSLESESLDESADRADQQSLGSSSESPSRMMQSSILAQTPASTSKQISATQVSPLMAPFIAENHKQLMIASYTDSRKLIGEFIKISSALSLHPMQWTYSEGLKALSQNELTQESQLIGQKRFSPWELLGSIRSDCQNGFRKNTLYILEDFHYYLTRENLSGQEFAEMISMIKSLTEPLKRAGSFLVILAPNHDLPAEIAPLFETIKGEAGKKSTPLLERYGRDFTKLVLEKKIKPLVGRDNEIRECLKILSRLEGNNPLLVGKAGVGKTALVEGMATKIVKNEVPESFRNKRLIALNLNAMISGTKYRGEFEKRLEGILEEVMSNKESIIIFIDEIHTLLGMGSTEGSAGAENVLKPYLARGDFPCIGATTYEEYKKHIEPDRALARRFQMVDVAEPSAQETYQILLGIKNIYESHHRVKISNEALVKCVQVSENIPNQYFPGKAIKLLDSVCSAVSFAGKDLVGSDSVVEEFERL